MCQILHLATDTPIHIREATWHPVRSGVENYLLLALIPTGRNMASRERCMILHNKNRYCIYVHTARDAIVPFCFSVASRIVSPRCRHQNVCGGFFPYVKTMFFVRCRRAGKCFFCSKHGCTSIRMRWFRV